MKKGENGEIEQIAGLLGYFDKDIHGFFVITEILYAMRNFSQNILLKMAALSKWATKACLLLRKQFVETIKKNQLEAAKFYHDMRVVTPVINKYKQGLKERVEAKKQNASKE